MVIIKIISDIDKYINVNKQAYSILTQHRATTADIFNMYSYCFFYWMIIS